MRRARRLVPIDLKMTADNKNSLYKVTENGITYYISLEQTVRRKDMHFKRNPMYFGQNPMYFG